MMTVPTMMESSARDESRAGPRPVEPEIQGPRAKLFRRERLHAGDTRLRLLPDARDVGPRFARMRKYVTRLAGNPT